MKPGHHTTSLILRALSARVKKVVDFMRDFNKDEATSLAEAEAIIKEFRTMKRPAKFAGLNLPQSMWLDIEQKVNQMESNLPLQKLYQKKAEHQDELQKQIDHTDVMLKFWSTPYTEFDKVQEMYSAVGAF